MDQQSLEENKQDEQMIDESQNKQEQQVVAASTNNLPKVYLWGSAENDQMDLGEDKSETRSGFEISFFSINKLEVVSVVCGGLHTLALTKFGQIYSWGCSDDGILGRQSTMESCKQPGLVPLDCPVDMIATGDTHSIAANSKHSLVFFWGVYRNSSGQMGEVAQTPQRVGEQDFKDKIISKILCGYNHSLFFIKKSIDDKYGEVLTQGEPDSSVIGRKPTARHKIEQSLKIIGLGVNYVVDIYTGAKHAFLKQIKHATKNKGGNEIQEKILGWGLNNYGQLGLGHTQEQVLRPEEIDFFNTKEVINIVGGDEHTLALTSDGKVYGFGRNDDGTLGLGEDYEQPKEEQIQPLASTKKKPTTKKQQKQAKNDQMQDENQEEIAQQLSQIKRFKFVTLPTEIPGLKNVIDINCGMSCSYAICKTNQGEMSVYSWGDSEHYLLGNGKDDEPVFEPYQIKNAFFKNQKLLVTKSFTGQDTYQLQIGGQHGAFIVIPDQYSEEYGSFDDKAITEVDEKYISQSKKTPFRGGRSSKVSKMSAQSNASKKGAETIGDKKDTQMSIEEDVISEQEEKKEDAGKKSKPTSKTSKKGNKGKQKQQQQEKIDEEEEEQEDEPKQEQKDDQKNEQIVKQQQQEDAEKSIQKQTQGRSKSSSKVQVQQQSPAKISEKPTTTPQKKELSPQKTTQKSPEKEGKASLRKQSKSPEKQLNIKTSVSKKSKSPEKKQQQALEDNNKTPEKSVRITRGASASKSKVVEQQQQLPKSSKKQPTSEQEQEHIIQTRQKSPTPQVMTRSHQKSPLPSHVKQSESKQQQVSASKQQSAANRSKTPLKSETKSKGKQVQKQKEEEQNEQQLTEQIEEDHKQQDKEEEEIEQAQQQNQDSEKEEGHENKESSQEQQQDEEQVEQKQASQAEENEQVQAQNSKQAEEFKQQQVQQNIQELNKVDQMDEEEIGDQVQDLKSQQQQEEKDFQKQRSLQSQQSQQQSAVKISSQQQQLSQKSQHLSQDTKGKVSKKRDYDQLTKDDDDSKLSMEELQDPLKKIKEQ